MDKNIKQIIIFFCLTIPLGWAFWIPMILINRGIISIPIPIIIFSTLGGVSPLITVLLLEKIFWKNEPSPKLSKKIFQTASIKKKDTFYLIFAALTIPFIYILSNILNRWRGYQVESQFINSGPATIGWALIIIIPITFFAMLLSSPILEEPGWRGFAIVELDKYIPRIFSSLIVGIYWWIWHQGMNIAFDMWPTRYSFFAMVFDSFLIDALFRKSGYNLLVAMFAHSSYAVAITYLFSIQDNYIKLLLTGVIIIIVYLLPNSIVKPADLKENIIDSEGKK